MVRGIAVPACVFLGTALGGLAVETWVLESGLGLPWLTWSAVGFAFIAWLVDFTWLKGNPMGKAKRNRLAREAAIEPRSDVISPPARLKALGAGPGAAIAFLGARDGSPPSMRNVTITGNRVRGGHLASVPFGGVSGDMTIDNNDVEGGSAYFERDKPPE
jgi:hypothetical protein